MNRLKINRLIKTSHQKRFFERSQNVCEFRSTILRDCTGAGEIFMNGNLLNRNSWRISFIQRNILNFMKDDAITTRCSSEHGYFRILKSSHGVVAIDPQHALLLKFILAPVRMDDICRRLMISTGVEFNDGFTSFSWIDPPRPKLENIFHAH